MKERCRQQHLVFIYTTKCHDPRDYNLNARLRETLRTQVCNPTIQCHVKQRYRN
jgi:hypothetical protein